MEWDAISFSRGSSGPKDRTHGSCIAGRFFTIWTTREVIYIWHTRVHTHLKTSQSSTLKKINKPVSKWAVYIVELGFPDSASCEELATSVGDVRVGVQSLGQEYSLEDGVATHSSVLAWRIPRMEEPEGLQSIGSQSQTWLKWLNTHTHTHIMELYVTSFCSFQVSCKCIIILS